MSRDLLLDAAAKAVTYAIRLCDRAKLHDIVDRLLAVKRDLDARRFADRRAS